MKRVMQQCAVIFIVGVWGVAGCGDIVVEPGPPGQDVTPPPADTTGGSDVSSPDTVGGPDGAADTLVPPDTARDVVLPECRLNSDCEGALPACQIWRCVEGRCVASPLTGDLCDASDPCVEEAHCEDGLCVATARVECPPQACRGDGVCEGGDCTYAAVPDGQPCDDLDLCTRNDVCTAGACGGEPVVCPVPTPCQEQGVCQPDSGRCEYAHVADGIPCDDGLICTEDKACSDGLCVAAGVRLCDDGVACTVDTCDERLGGCVHDLSNCPCVSNDDCVEANLCLTGSICDISAGLCTVSVPVDCGDLDAPCARGACVPTTGLCEARPVVAGTACDDDDPCTTTDRCDGGGSCHGTARSCDDGIACTIDTCDAATGECRHDARNCGCTSDGDCVGTDRCAGAGRCDLVSYTCQPGTPVSCRHLDESCKWGVCNLTTGECQSEPRQAGISCDDSDLCTVADICDAAGTCSGRPMVCDDTIDCTVDSCDPASGVCQHDPSACGCAHDADCDDGNPCNGHETCDTAALHCIPGTAVDCSHLTGPCKTGVCDSADGSCIAEITAGAVCDDSDSCTTGDQCRTDGVCAGTPVRCDDGDPCTTDTCRDGACQTEPASGRVCTSPLPCGALGGVCDAGRCICACRDEMQLNWLQESIGGGDARGVFTFSSRTYGSTGALVCPSDWLSDGVLRREITSGPVDMKWQRLCATDAAVWDWRTDYAAATSYWDARARGLMRGATFVIRDGSGREVARFGARNIQFNGYAPPYGTCTGQETLSWVINDSRLRGVFAEFARIGSARLGRFRLLLEGSTRWTAWMSGPEDWTDPALRRGGSMEIENPCEDRATRAEFGNRGLWDGYEAGAMTDAVVILRDDSGNEVRRINLFGVVIRTYAPSYDACREKEVITVTFTKAENG